MEAKLPDTGKAACASMRKETSWGKAWPGQGAHWLEAVDQQIPCQNLAQMNGSCFPRLGHAQRKPAFTIYHVFGGQ